MAIRVSYGDVSAYGQLGQLAGQAQAAKEAVARQHEIATLNQQLAARRQELEMQQQHDIERDNFRSWLTLERDKRAEAWELEKMETNSRLQYDLQARLKTMAVEASFQEGLNNLLLQRKQLDQKKQWLDKALEDGRITQTDYEKYSVGLELGPALYQAVAGRDNIFGQMFGQDDTPVPGAPDPTRGVPAQVTSGSQAERVGVFQKAAQFYGKLLGYDPDKERVEIASRANAILPRLSPDEQEDYKNIMASGNLEKMKEAERLAMEKVRQSAPPMPVKATGPVAEEPQDVEITQTVLDSINLMRQSNGLPPITLAQLQEIRLYNADPTTYDVAAEQSRSLSSGIFAAAAGPYGALRR